MKKIARFYSIVVMMSGLTVLINACNSTNRVTAAETANIVTKAIDSSKWVFVPVDIMPQYGTSRHADPNFSVTYNNNKLIVYLPYFGRAFSGADVLSTKGPLDFTSTDFTISKRETKKGHWSISIKPKDYREVQAMNFMFYSNGSANLSVTMTNRTGISFSGTVDGWKQD